MKLKLVLEKIEDVEEHFRDLYTEDAKTKKWVFTGVEGIKTTEDITKLQAGVAKERADHKETKAKLEAATATIATFADIGDPTEIGEKLVKLASYEAQEGGNKKTIDDAVAARVEAVIKGKTLPLERKINELTTANTSLTTANVGLTQEKTRNIRHGAVRAAALEAKVVDTAVEDVLLVCDRVFTEIGEDGTVTTKEGLAPADWLAEIQTKKPHWWPVTKGAGAGGGHGLGNLSDNPWTAAGWNLTKQGRQVQADPTKADQMAKAAGHDKAIGARRPAPQPAK